MKSKHMNSNFKTRSRRRGTAFVEFALVAPFLLAMLVGVIDFGLLERNTLIVANAAREGARAASLGRTTADIRTRIENAATPPLTKNSSGVITNPTILTILMEHAAPSGDPLSYQSWPSDTVSSGTTPINGVPQGNYVRITLTYSHRSLSGLLNRTMAIPAMMRREA